MTQGELLCPESDAQSDENVNLPIRLSDGAANVRDRAWWVIELAGVPWRLATCG